MRLPIPRNRLVVLALVGALLTTLVAGALAVPGLLSADDGTTTLAPDAPAPNQEFTPAVLGGRDGGDEHAEAEEDDHHEEDEEDHDALARWGDRE